MKLSIKKVSPAEFLNLQDQNDFWSLAYAKDLSSVISSQPDFDYCIFTTKFFNHLKAPNYLVVFRDAKHAA